MKISRLTILFTVLSLCLIFPEQTPARKKGYRLKAQSENPKGEKSGTVHATETDPRGTSAQRMEPGCFMVTSQCKSGNNGYRLDQVVFTGFDKNQGNSKESFFIINNTDRTLKGVSLYIDYRTLDGRQLHKRFFKLKCNIPAGETRKSDIPTWDTQHSFYYHKSKTSKHRGNPFDVKFDPVAYYLQF